MPALTKDEIQEATDAPKMVDVPAWGGQVQIRKMSVRARDTYMHAIMHGRMEDEPASVQAEIVQMCMTAPKYDTPADLQETEGEGVKQIFNAILIYSGIVKTKGGKGNGNGNTDVDEAEKNSETTAEDSPSSSSSSDSDSKPSPSSKTE